MNKNDRLAISFWIWGLYDTCEQSIYHDCEKCMKEAVERGFNCIRMDSGAGFYCDTKGNPRGTVHIRLPFGEYSQFVRQSDVLVKEGMCNLPERLLTMFRAAKKYGVRIILSSWYFLHTNWFADDEINEEIFALPLAEKMKYFTLELDRALKLLEENDLIDQLAFAELFNEYDGTFHDGFYPMQEKPSFEELRAYQEEAIAYLKERHPSSLFAFDTYHPWVNENIIPRNADVVDYHSYYLWSVYDVFQKNYITRDPSEPDYLPETLEYLYKDRVKVADVIRSIGRELATGRDWMRRVALYSSIDPEKLPALEALLENYLEENVDKYRASRLEAVQIIKATVAKVLPNAKLVLGEGVAYCPNNKLLFEEKSELYWKLLEEQADLMRENGLWGNICRTTNGPEDPAWQMFPEKLKEINERFLKDNICKNG